MQIDSAPRSGTSPHPDDLGRGAGAASAERTAQGVTAQLTAPPAPASAPASQAIEGGAIELRTARRPLSTRARIWLAIGIVALAVAFLLVVRTVLQPFIWAAVVAYILNPVVALLQRRLHIRRGLGVAVVMLVLLGLLVWGITAMVPQLRADAAALASNLPLLNNYLTTYLPNAGTLTILGVSIQTTQIVSTVQAGINDLPHLLLHNGWDVVATSVETLLRFLTFLISTFYLLLDGPRLGRWLAGRVPERYRPETVGVGRNIHHVLSEYLRAELILIVLMSTVSLIALSVMGVQFAFLLAPVVGFLEIFPIIGPFVAITLVALVALISPPNFGLSHAGFTLVVALVFFILRQIEDYLVIPNVVGHAVKLHPVLILFALLSGATIGGILGMFLAVPVTGALKVLGSYAYDRLVE